MADQITLSHTWYKVLSADNEPAHGGAKDFSWPLPTADGPGAWTPEIAEVHVCRRGYHLTNDPMRWPVVGMRVYEAEGEGAFHYDPNDGPGHKTAFARARLLREVPEVVPEWWRAVERFVREEIPAVPWLRPDGDPDPAWALFERPTWAAARAAAVEAVKAVGVAAWDTARAAAWAATGDETTAAGADVWNAVTAVGAAVGDAAWDHAREVSRDAARATAWVAALLAAEPAAGSFAGDAAWDAALLAAIRACDGLPIPAEHVAHAEARWRVWQKGYALLCDADGKLIVYAATEG